LINNFITGYVYDQTQSLSWSFRFGGMLMILSALVCLFKSPTERWQSRRIKSFHDATVSRTNNREN